MFQSHNLLSQHITGLTAASSGIAVLRRQRPRRLLRLVLVPDDGAVSGNHTVGATRSLKLIRSSVRAMCEEVVDGNESILRRSPTFLECVPSILTTHGAVPGDAHAGGQQRGGGRLARPRAVCGGGPVHRDDAAQGQRDEHVRGLQGRRRDGGGHRAHGLMTPGLSANRRPVADAGCSQR